MVFKGRTVIVLLVIAMVSGSLLTAGMMNIEQNVISNLVKGIASDDKSITETEPTNGSSTDTAAKEGIPQEQLQKLSELYSIIKGRYYKDVDDTKLINGAINGMVNAVEDPYTTYMDPEVSKNFQSNLQSSFEGIGAEVTMRNGRVTIVSPFKGSPAEKSGLRPNDQVISVNGDSLEGLSLYEATSKIKGPKGTEARLEIMRPGVKEVLKITVIRDKIPLETVYAEMVTDTIGKIELTQFSANTADRFNEELSNLKKKGMKALIIDVRDNPGGYLNSVLEISETILPKGKVIVQVEDKEGDRDQYTSKADGLNIPIAILINKGSASASEILAGTLQESYDGLVIGNASFGKGTVQNTELLEDGSSLKITIAKWLTPTGKWIHEKGIAPDVEVNQPEYFQVIPFAEDVNLKLDSNGNDVKNLQLMLKAVGYEPGRTDGYFSQETEKAVRQFQTANKLTVTGKVDNKTAVLLQDKTIDQMRDPKNDVQLQTTIKLIGNKIK